MMKPEFTEDSASLRRRWPATLWIGAGIMLITEVMVLIDAAQRGWRVVPEQALADPQGLSQHITRWFASSITPLAWTGYLLFFEGLLTKLAWRRGDRRGSCVRKRPWLFTVAYLTSVPVWCYFDVINFYMMQAWRYHFPDYLTIYERWGGYFIAFAAISPAMFLAGQLFQQLGLRRFTSQADPKYAMRVYWVCLAIGFGCVAGLIHLVDPDDKNLNRYVSLAILLVPAVAGGLIFRRALIACFIMGLTWTIWAVVVANPIANFVLWAAPVFLLDPINAAMGKPSVIRDWQAGRWGRSVALMAGGLLCGFLWEFWNFWAVSKWTYHLPFLGATEQIRYFEMPVVGLLGFMPFGVSCWVMLITITAMLPGITEPLRDPHDVL